jgi:hypothetical protein
MSVETPFAPTSKRIALIAFALPVVCLPFIIRIRSADGIAGLSWLDIASATSLAAAAILVGLTSWSPKLRALCDSPLHPALKYVAFLIVAIAAIWALFRESDRPKAMNSQQSKTGIPTS